MVGSCPACGSESLSGFFRLDDVPLSSLILVDTQETARTWPRGAIDMASCSACGFVFNRAFRPEAVDYTMPYEESQAFSPRFREFEAELVEHLAATYDLEGKVVFEVGCGKASFLQTLCVRSGAEGVGIDPAFVPDRIDHNAPIRGIREYFGEHNTHLTGDLIVCRHTLEHIQPVEAFVRLLHESAKQTDGAAMFIEVPESERILAEGAFWDVYYEHCSYFTGPSLEGVFRAGGFEISSLRLGFDDQYLLLDCRLGHDDHPVNSAGVERVVTLADDFGRKATAEIARWRTIVDDLDGATAVLWGAGSKAVAFLSAIQRDDAFLAAVDINPFKQSMFLPGSALPVIAPDDLIEIRPDLVIVMNPAYVAEISTDLDRLGLTPRVEALGAPA